MHGSITSKNEKFLEDVNHLTVENWFDSKRAMMKKLPSTNKIEEYYANPEARLAVTI